MRALRDDLPVEALPAGGRFVFRVTVPVAKATVAGWLKPVPRHTPQLVVRSEYRWRLIDVKRREEKSIGIPFGSRGPHLSAASNEGSIDMKTMFAAAIALAMGTGSALADGPYAPITPFVIWINENAAGKPLTRMPDLMRMAHNGERLNSTPTPRGFAQEPPAQGAAVQN